MVCQGGEVMRKRKYMMSGGLAFLEESDMERLRKKSLQGWHLKKFSFLGYRLERGESADVIYTIDYHLLDKEDQAEYFDMFEMAGWEHVCTEHNMHVFKAPKGTKPIYTDSDTTKEKYNRLAKSWKKASIVLLGIFLLSFSLIWKTTGIVQNIGSIGFTVTLILFVPCCMTYIALFRRKAKKYDENGGVK